MKRNPKQKDLILVGNKVDLPDKREVSYQEALDFSSRVHIHFVEVSASSLFNVEFLYELIRRRNDK